MSGLFTSLSLKIVQGLRSFQTPIYVNQVRFGSSLTQYDNLPPVTNVSGRGSTFETQIRRKKILQNPNKPNFEHIEPLKWTTWKMLSDVRRRHIFRDYYFERGCLTSVQKNQMLPRSVRVSAHNSNNFNSFILI